MKTIKLNTTSYIIRIVTVVNKLKVKIDDFIQIITYKFTLSAEKSYNNKGFVYFKKLLKNNWILP